MATAELLEPQELTRADIEAALSDPVALWELEYGRVVEKPMSAFALAISTRLIELVAAECRRLGLGCWYSEMVFILDDARRLRRRPDVAYVAAARWPVDRPLPLKGDWSIAPNIAVEVLSPGNLADQVARKRREYLRYGIEEVWIIYPEERVVEVYDAQGIREYSHVDRLTSPLLPGIEIELDKLLPLAEEAS